MYPQQNMERRENFKKTNLKPLITNPVEPGGFISWSWVVWGHGDLQATLYSNQSIIVKNQ